MRHKHAKQESSIGADSPQPSSPDRRAFLKAGAALSAAAGGMLVPAAAPSGGIL